MKIKILGFRISKRNVRRNRHRKKAALDALALQRIENDFLWSAATWGGTRCPGCGIKVKPRFLVNLNRKLGNIWIEGFASACQFVKCPGENSDWMDQA